MPTPTSSAPHQPGHRPLDSLPGVGPRTQDALERLGIRWVGDLLRHYPARWVDRRTVRALGELSPALLSPPRPKRGDLPREEISVLGQVRDVRTQGPRNRQRVEVLLVDDTGSVALVFFGGGWRSAQFPVGSFVLVSGPLGSFRGRFQFQNPDYEILAREEEAAFHSGSLFPVYPLTRGVSQRQVRGWVRDALQHELPRMSDALPPEIRRKFHLLDLPDAVRGIHFPASADEREAARRRLAFEELFLDQLFVYAVRLRREMGKIAPAIEPGGALSRRIRASLPFSLTEDQRKALEEIEDDLATTRPMNRLLQGDVGSGKTVVAFLAAAAAADRGIQTAFLVPTEILAGQHLKTLRELGGGFGLEPRMLAGSMSAPARREVLTGLADGSTPLVVGTHALFQEGVRFRHLGFVVVDEQHRFGVMQRVALLEKGEAPHVLAMSATPIPRSLALVRYADLDLSVIQQRPAGRGTTLTRRVPEPKRSELYRFVADQLREGRQAYIIYPLVEESETSQLKAATTMVDELAGRPELAGATISLLHGQMKSDDKDRVMSRFASGEVGILVATTVVEVGIDVPNATIMIIEHPERYGLSQLHQLRGRVGRGEYDSYCFLMEGQGDVAETRERLRLFSETDDGFKLAEIDLEMRGQGDLSGIRQSGRPGYRLADPWRDRRMAEVARDEARAALDSGLATGEGGADWEPLRRGLRDLLDEAGARVEAG